MRSYLLFEVTVIRRIKYSESEYVDTSPNVLPELRHIRTWV